jgi:hypothetical protein
MTFLPFCLLSIYWNDKQETIKKKGLVIGMFGIFLGCQSLIFNNKYLMVLGGLFAAAGMFIEIVL